MFVGGEMVSLGLEESSRGENAEAWGIFSPCRQAEPRGVANTPLAARS